MATVNGQLVICKSPDGCLALFPLPMAVFCAVFVRSLWATYVRRSVTWKGRSLDLRPADAEAGS